jgi:single-stranded-DNA-specific exonuclease
MSTKRAIRQRDFHPADDRLGTNLDPVIRRVLLSRGVTRKEDLTLDMRAMLPPGELSGVNEAAQLIALAVMQDQRILIEERGISRSEPF